MKQIMIAGPTCSGKSRLAVTLAKKIDAEIISADSRQCYKEINIGTAKPTAEQLQSVRHYNISDLHLTEDDSAQKFYERAKSWSSEIERRGKRVIYAGGSTLHLQSLIRPLDDIPSSNSDNVEALTEELKEKGVEHLFKKLSEVDPVYAGKIEPNNHRQIIRALDVWMQTGEPFSSFHRDDKFEEPENIAVYGLHWPRKMLHERISRRCDEMLEKGLVSETRNLLDAGCSQNLQALQTVGYKQVIQHLNGEIDYEQMVKDFKTATRRYAKRQITWLRRWPFLTWLDHSKADVEMLAERIEQQVAADVQKG